VVVDSIKVLRNRAGRLVAGAGFFWLKQSRGRRITDLLNDWRLAFLVRQVIFLVKDCWLVVVSRVSSLFLGDVDLLDFR
jgi:hypothetical protein